MKISLLAALFFGQIYCLHAQQIFLKGGKSISVFDYHDTQGKSLENLQSTSQTYLGIGYSNQLAGEKLFLTITGTCTDYGSTGSDRSLDNYFTWDATYMGLAVGLDYHLFHPNNFSFYLKGSVGAEALIRGSQTINNQVYNLADQDDFKSLIHFFRAGPGVQYRAGESLSVFAEYLYGKGGMFKNRQGDLKIINHCAGIGLLIDIESQQR